MFCCRRSSVSGIRDLTLIRLPILLVWDTLKEMKNQIETWHLEHLNSFILHSFISLCFLVTAKNSMSIVNVHSSHRKQTHDLGIISTVFFKRSWMNYIVWCVSSSLYDHILVKNTDAFTPVLHNRSVQSHCLCVDKLRRFWYAHIQFTSFYFFFYHVTAIHTMTWCWCNNLPSAGVFPVTVTAISLYWLVRVSIYRLCSQILVYCSKTTHVFSPQAFGIVSTPCFQRGNTDYL